MRFSVMALASVSALALVAGCSSPSSPSPVAGPADPAPGTEGAPKPEEGAPVGTPAGKDVNPYGVAYPTADIGSSARAGTTAGNRIANFKFYGYPNGDKAKGIQVVSLADFFDPEMKSYKVIHLIASSAWCNPCIEETKETAKLKATLESEKVVFVQALIDGTTLGTGATKADLDRWIDKQGVNFTAMLDPNVANLGPFFKAAAVPWNANIDARSMEILYAKEGAPADIAKDVRRWTAWVDANPAKQ